MSQRAPTIKNILDQTSLKWIFVGGKGGVGKTTCSCCIAVQLAKVRDKVLLISTDPAHNLSDAFDQKFSKVPTKVKGFSNLFAMEIDPSLNVEDLEGELFGQEEAALSASIGKSITSIMSSFPGIDEYKSYTELFRLVQGLDYSCVVFDTAPTGHTLRLLGFPEMMAKSLGKIVGLKNQFAPFLNQIMSFLGINSDQDIDITNMLENYLPVVRKITEQFKDPSKTTFVCVCIPEFLSMYETERLVQELTAQEIDVHNIIVNQLLFPKPVLDDEGNSIAEICDEPNSSCRMCLARHRIQNKYLEQILELYEDMHVMQLPLLEDEVRGADRVRYFSENLIKPFRR